MIHQQEGYFERLHQLVTLQLDGQATADDVRALAELLRNNDWGQQLYVEMMQDTASLRWWSTNVPTVKLPISDSLAAVSSIAAGEESTARSADLRLLRTAAGFSDDERSPPYSTTGMPEANRIPLGEGLVGSPRRGPLARCLERISSPRWMAIAAAIVAMVTIGSHYYVNRMARELADVKGKLNRLERSQVKPALGFESNPHAKPLYSATLVNLTNCRWDKTRSTANFDGSGLHSGQSLHLLEGVAEVNSTLASGGMGKFQLEGPSAIMLSSEGIPNLLYGRLMGSFESDLDQFYLDTPLGRINVSRDASIGVVAAPNDLELHVFSGAAEVDFWSPTLKSASQPSKVESSTSLHATVASDGRLNLVRGNARENWFINPAATAVSRLKISEDYVATILAAKPLAYWRFESESEGLVRNEISDNLHCRMFGKAVRLHTGPGNRTAEFGFAPGAGYLMSDDTLDQSLVGESYTVEAWVKPTYCHHGVIFSLLDWLPGKSAFQRQYLHLELCGLVSGFAPKSNPLDEHAGRIRLLHRRNNWECFSSSEYMVRQWQHLVAVKEQAQLRLYTDGNEVGKVRCKGNPVGTNTRVLMGQLYPLDPQLLEVAPSRVFVGEMDEVAFYNRALGIEEIKEHCELINSDSEPSREATSDRFQ